MQSRLNLLTIPDLHRAATCRIARSNQATQLHVNTFIELGEVLAEFEPEELEEHCEWLAPFHRAFFRSALRAADRVSPRSAHLCLQWRAGARIGTLSDQEPGCEGATGKLIRSTCAGTPMASLGMLAMSIGITTSQFLSTLFHQIQDIRLLYQRIVMMFSIILFM